MAGNLPQKRFPSGRYRVRGGWGRKGRKGRRRRGVRRRNRTVAQLTSVQLQLPTLWKALLQLRLPLLLLLAVQLLSLVTVFWMSTWSSSGELLHAADEEGGAQQHTQDAQMVSAGHPARAIARERGTPRRTRRIRGKTKQSSFSKKKKKAE